MIKGKKVAELSQLIGVIFAKLLYQVDYHKDEDKERNWGVPLDTAKAWFTDPRFDVEFSYGVHGHEDKDMPHDTKYFITKMRKL
ncbi:MAG: hypothetical protein WC613_00375 [Candidatus Aenigmatarchaeota archaeon]